uniref:Putative ovule protein n=1 Tax=Solanum chacoense TaxID=4108 RepID=A0A0V0I1M9_SOLCH
MRGNMVHNFRGKKGEKLIGTRANSEFPTNSQIQNLHQDQRTVEFCMRFRLKSQKIWTSSSVDGFDSFQSPLCLTCRHLVATRAIGRGWQDWNGLVRADVVAFPGIPSFDCCVLLLNLTLGIDAALTLVC